MSMHDPAPSGAPGRPAAAKVSPESMALRAQPRPVTRLNRRSLALLAGLLALGVLGATVWSLQPKTRRESSEPAELFNVDRVSRSEGLGQLPADYSKLPPPAPAPVPELGPPLPGDLGPAIVKSQQPVVPSYSPPGHDPAASERDARRKEAEQAAAASVFFRNGSQRTATAAPTTAAPGTPSSMPSGLTGFDPMAAGPAPTPAQASGADATMLGLVRKALDKETDADIKPLLELLANHYALGVVTNGNADVRRLGLADYFKFALCAEDIGIAKPDARLFHEALQRGEATAETAVHIGDHPGDDIAGAQQAGLRAIWFNPAGKTWEAERLPNAEIRSLTELPGLLAGWNKTRA